MKINEIDIDDSQTGYYWVQIFVKNQREAFSLKKQIFHDQAIRKRLHNEIIQSQKAANDSSIELEVIINNIIAKKLKEILDGEEGT